jgi:hypothetical protein
MSEDDLSGSRLHAGRRRIRRRTVPDDAADAVPDPDHLRTGDVLHSAAVGC